MGDDAIAQRESSSLPESEAPVGTGISLFDAKLGGGISHGSLTLIEGPSSAGKSVLCQHLAHGSLLEGRGVAYITTENTAATLSHKMDSIGLHVSQDLQPGRFQIFSLELSSSDPHPEFSMENMAYGIERLPSQYEVIIVDSITDVAADCQDRAIKSFFSRCKRLCSNGRTIILTIHPDIFEDKLLTRLRALCDAQLSLSVERQGEKLLNVMEVRKVHNAKLDTGNVVSFEIRPEIGIRIVPIRNVRA